MHAWDQGGNDRVMILARADLLVLGLSAIVEELIIVDTVVCGCNVQRSTVDDGEVVSCFESAFVRALLCGCLGMGGRRGGTGGDFMPRVPPAWNGKS